MGRSQLMTNAYFFTKFVSYRQLSRMQITLVAFFAGSIMICFIKRTKIYSFLVINTVVTYVGAYHFKSSHET